MTTEEIFREYKKLFILVMETAGETTGNESYLNVEKLLNSDNAKRLFKQHIENDDPFGVFVTTCMVLLVVDIHGAEKLVELDEIETTELVTSMYTTYLKKPTKRFAAKYGLSVYDEPDAYIKIILANHE